MTLLEIQVSDLDQDVNFLFDEQVIQDEKLLNLEQETDAIDAELEVIDGDLESKFSSPKITWHLHAGTYIVFNLPQNWSKNCEIENFLDIFHLLFDPFCLLLKILVRIAP